MNIGAVYKRRAINSAFCTFSSAHFSAVTASLAQPDSADALDPCNQVFHQRIDVDPLSAAHIPPALLMMLTGRYWVHELRVRHEPPLLLQRKCDLVVPGHLLGM